MANMRSKFLGVLAAALLGAAPAAADEIKVLSAGAFLQVLTAMTPDFEKRTGHKRAVTRGTVGQLMKRVEEGEAFDLVVVTPAGIEKLIAAGHVAAGTAKPLARVGIGVMVKEGAVKPDVGTVEAFKKTLLAAKSVSYIDPKSGGSSGIYTAQLLERLGIADQIRPKEKLKQGGHVAELVISGEAEIGVQQISEIIPVQGVAFAGPLPKEIQNYTVYAAGIGAKAARAGAARALLETLVGPGAAAELKAKGMEPPG
ncbi:MAG: ABC transporter substrate-binding protein [Rhodospirillales bacterium]|nr:ABC transporter substrate-binding protein [Rhodospirillales bacterium]